MAKIQKAPILPSTPSDPTGADRLERGAMLEFDKRIRRVRQAYLDGLERIPAALSVNKRYAYELDPLMLSSILTMAGRVVDDMLLQGGEQNVWFFEAYVSTAYRRGTAQAFANLSRQSPAYAGGQESLASIIRSEPYRRRIALVAAREFEEMQGLAGNVKANMARILTDGVARGLNPREVAKTLTQQAGIEARRAHRIARTEITTALRRARMDETDDAGERYGLRTLEMHYSALSPTTRKSHADRHGKLFTTDEQRDWWSEGGNSANCKCSTISVMVDADGEPLVPAIVERAREAERKMRAKGKGPWATEE